MTTDNKIAITASEDNVLTTEEIVIKADDTHTGKDDGMKSADITAVAQEFVGRFSFDENGQILWQKEISNPLPGHVVASLVKGKSFFKPSVAVLSGVTYADQANLEADVQKWVEHEIALQLGGITRFAEAEMLPQPLKDIAKALEANHGVVDRYLIEQPIKDLDADLRKILRQHKVRLGPIVAYFYEHLKPEPLKIKTILWALDNDLDTTPIKPKDGVVSEVVDLEKIDQKLYKTLGYPVYGERAIRIDMLDRVINDIYDNADAGQFRAQHKYAEWLGCSIESLYKALEAMGHYKIEGTEDPRPENKDSDETKLENKASEHSTTETTDKTNENEKVEQAQQAPNQQAPKEPQQKPKLSLFKLKKGKLSVAPSAFHKKDKPAFKNKEKPNKDRKKPSKAKKDPRKQQKEPRVMSFGAQQKDLFDSPFAVLKDLDLSK